MALLSGRSQGSRHSLLAGESAAVATKSAFCESAAPAMSALPKALRLSHKICT